MAQPFARSHSLTTHSVAASGPSSARRIAPTEMAAGSLARMYPPCAPRMESTSPALRRGAMSCSR